MLQILKYEIEKSFKTIQIRVGLLSAVLFSILVYMMKKGNSTFFAPINVLNNIGITFMLALLITLSTYVYGLEIDSNTLKILKTKQLRTWQFMLIKYLVAILYSLAVLAVIFIVTLFIGLAFCPMNDVYLDFAHLTIQSDCALLFIMKLYLLQAIANIFIVTVCLFIVIVTNAPGQSVVLSFFAIIGLSLLSNLPKWGFKLAEYILPFYSNSFANFVIINRNNMGSVFYKLCIFVLYSIALFFISVYIYKRSDVN